MKPFRDSDSPCVKLWVTDVWNPTWQVMVPSLSGMHWALMSQGLVRLLPQLSSGLQPFTWSPVKPDLQLPQWYEPCAGEKRTSGFLWTAIEKPHKKKTILPHTSPSVQITLSPQSCDTVSFQCSRRCWVLCTRRHRHRPEWGKVISDGMQPSQCIQVQFWVLSFELVYTSSPLHFRGKYCNIYFTLGIGSRVAQFKTYLIYVPVTFNT